MSPRVLVLLALAGCVDSVPEASAVPPNVSHDYAGKPTAKLATDLCDDSAYAGMTWQTTSSQHFVLNYLPNTPAETDRDAIVARLESGYADIRAKLGIAAEPTLTVDLSPNRTAARAWGMGFGVSWPGWDWYDVIYTGAPDSFEVMRYGNLMTYVLDYYVDSADRNRVAFLTTGLGEYLDQWQRDHHDAYALALLAGTENRVHVAELEARDVNGRNPGRAGSLVQFLIDRYGMETFMAIYRATAVAWNGSCYASSTYGCIDTPAALTQLLDGVLTTTVGEGWSVVQPLWNQDVQAALARVSEPSVAAEIAELMHVMDRAVASHDPVLYRSTLEGFYCDYGGESLRRDISERAVTAFDSMSTKVLAVFDTGIKNFRTAQAIVQRTDNRGISIFSTLYFEHFPVGWRVTWGPDWF